MFTQLLVPVLCAITSCSAVEIQVIANKDLSVTALSSDDVADFYLGRRKKVSSGTNITVFTVGDPGETERFLDEFLDMTPAAFSASWKRMIFTGRGIPPAEVSDDHDMIDRIKRTPGSIGYVAAGTAVDGVVVLTITK